MKHMRSLAFAAVAMLASTTWASAQEAFTTGDVNMRAGPGSRYPVVTTIPEGREVFIHGCLSNWDWCDVSWRRTRGWVFSDYLEALWRGRRVVFDEYRTFIDIPFVSFSFGYWDRHYRDRPWFDDWDYWHLRRGPMRDHDYRRDGDDDDDMDRTKDRRRVGEDGDGDRELQRRNRSAEEGRVRSDLPRGCVTGEFDDEYCPENGNRGENDTNSRENRGGRNQMNDE